MDNLIEVVVKESAQDFATGQYKVVLQDKATSRILSIWVGQFEGNAIALGLEEAWTPRPMTHDLAINILAALKASVQRVVITDLKDNTFYAVIVFLAHEEEVVVDSRPSDALALAVRVKCPVFVSTELAPKMADELDEIFERLQPKATIH